MSLSEGAPAACRAAKGGVRHARPPKSRTHHAWRWIRRWLYLLHRWTGIVLCLLFAMWFVSGVVMMYVPFPSFRAQERIETAPPIDWTQVRVGPDAALAGLREAKFPADMRLGMTDHEPVYRFVTDAGRHAVSARTGNVVQPINAAKAAAIATAFLGHPASSVTAVDHDQWVVTKAYRKMAPFWRVRMADAAVTDLYVAQSTGEIVQNTTAHERFWNWLGAVPHWIYFTALRVNQEPWRQTVLWTSGIGLLGAIAGVWIGLLRVRIARRYKSGSISPYKGWMKWHHVTGIVGGVFVITWVFSGWLSMSPWGGLRDPDTGIAERFGDNRPGFVPTDLHSLAQSAYGATEVTFTYVGARPLMVALGGSHEKVLLDGSTAQPTIIATNRITQIARQAVNNGRLVAVERIGRPDRYWYTTGDPRSDSRPLPVLRLKFDDPAGTWLHVDPRTGALLNTMGSGSRSYRWLFAALHSFDLPWLLMWRPIRDGVMWIFSFAGLIISISGIVVGWRHLRPRREKRRNPVTAN